MARPARRPRARCRAACATPWLLFGAALAAARAGGASAKVISETFQVPAAPDGNGECDPVDWGKTMVRYGGGGAPLSTTVVDASTGRRRRADGSRCAADLVFTQVRKNNRRFSLSRVCFPRVV